MSVIGNKKKKSIPNIKRIYKKNNFKNNGLSNSNELISVGIQSTSRITKEVGLLVPGSAEYKFGQNIWGALAS